MSTNTLEAKGSLMNPLVAAGSVLSTLVLLFTLYSVSPWAARSEMLDVKIRVERLQLQVDGIDTDRRERGARIAALEVKTGENERRLARMEEKLDVLLARVFIAPPRLP